MTNKIRQNVCETAPLSRKILYSQKPASNITLFVKWRDALLMMLGVDMALPKWIVRRFVHHASFSWLF